jgi:hypothetical protein
MQNWRSIASRSKAPDKMFETKTARFISFALHLRPSPSLEKSRIARSFPLTKIGVTM